MRIGFFLASGLWFAAGAPALAQVTVSHAGRVWTIRGQKNTVELNEHDLAVTIHAGAVRWKMVPSGAQDMLVGAGGDRFWVRLADAGKSRLRRMRPDSRRGCG